MQFNREAFIEAITGRDEFEEPKTELSIFYLRYFGNIEDTERLQEESAYETVFEKAFLTVELRTVSESSDTVQIDLIFPTEDEIELKICYEQLEEFGKETTIYNNRIHPVFMFYINPKDPTFQDRYVMQLTNPVFWCRTAVDAFENEMRCIRFLFLTENVLVIPLEENAIDREGIEREVDAYLEENFVRKE